MTFVTLSSFTMSGNLSAAMVEVVSTTAHDMNLFPVLNMTLVPTRKGHDRGLLYFLD